MSQQRWRRRRHLQPLLFLMVCKKIDLLKVSQYYTQFESSMKNEGLSIFKIDTNVSHLRARCMGCDLIPRIGALSPIGLCVSCIDKRECVKCARYL